MTKGIQELCETCMHFGPEPDQNAAETHLQQQIAKVDNWIVELPGIPVFQQLKAQLESGDYIGRCALTGYTISLKRTCNIPQGEPRYEAKS